MSASAVHRVSDVVVAVCWGLFVLVWIAGALYNAQRAPEVERRSRASAVWFLVAVVVWLAFRLLPGNDWDELATHSSAVRVVGILVLVGFTAFTIWARIVLGTMWSSSIVAKSEHVLHTDGPYAITRHPIYTGIVGMLLGTVLAVGFGVWTTIFVLGVLVVEVKIHAEERLLSEVFPVAYPAYRRSVPQLVPGLRLLRRKHAG